MENKTVYIFLGCYCKNIKYSFFQKKYYKSKISVSNSEFEKILFNGFLSEEKNAIMISAPNVGRWPFTCKKTHFKAINNDNHNISCSYSTFFLTSNFSKTSSLKKAIIKKIKENLGSKIIVIACEAHRPYLEALKLAKKKFNCRTSLIVPDLPNDMTRSNSLLYNFFKKRDIKLINAIIDGYVDTFYLFTKEMINRIDVSNKKYIVREGILKDISSCKTNNAVIQCTYIGKTDKRNGVSLIVEAAKKMPDLSFNIYGSGDLDSYLSKCNIDNLHFFGFIDPIKIDTILGNSDIMLSPRFPDASYTSTSFPSKIMKYLSYSKPIVTFKLPCYDVVFDSILIYPKNTDLDSFVDAIDFAKKSINCNLKSVFETRLKKYLVKNIVKDYLEILNIDC